MYKWIPFAAAVPLLAGCQTLPGMGMAGTAFNDVDEDGDSVINRREAQAVPALTNNFSRIDTNDSGGIDEGEYAAARLNLADVRFQEVDINGDGVVSEREADAMPDSLKAAFGTVDADGDGNVSPSEYRAATVSMLEGVDFSTLDRDGDGVISTSEADRMPALAEIFGRVDTDDDDQITREEYGAAQR